MAAVGVAEGWRGLGALLASLVLASCVGGEGGGADAVGSADVGRLDEASSRLVTALQEQDYKKFRALASKRLEGRVSRGELRAMGVVVERLGPCRGREYVSSRRGAKGAEWGEYDYLFKKGAVRVRVELREGEIESFAFSGETLEAARYEVARESKLRVLAFRYVDAGGRRLRRGEVKPGRWLGLELEVAGLRQGEGVGGKGGGYRVEVGLEVVNRWGKVVGHFPEWAVGQVEGELAVATVRGRVRLLRPGSYTLRFVARDPGRPGKVVRFTREVVVRRQPGQAARRSRGPRR